MDIPEEVIKRLDINKKELEFLATEKPPEPESPKRYLIRVLLMGAIVFWSIKHEEGLGANGALYLAFLLFSTFEYFQARRFYRVYSLALDIIKFYRSQDLAAKA